MFVNLNATRLYCSHCNHLNCSKKIANQILEYSKKLKLHDTEEREIQMIIECDNCHRNFEVWLLIEKYKLVYFVKE